MFELVSPRRRARLIHEIHHEPSHQVQGTSKGVRFRLWIDAQLFSGGEQVGYRASRKGLKLSGHAATVADAIRDIETGLRNREKP